jgi:maltose alpha-D-glucosyltransferase/alpha-amylase
MATEAGFTMDTINTTTLETDWYKDAVVYQLHVKSFFDSNNDGVGDLPGLIAKLDYIAGLGVNTIWLLPFYPSPRRDDGYDIAGYRDVHPDYGRLADVRRLIRAAHARGLRVVTELVVNHTSDQHPWFQRARLARPGTVARNYYVWSDTDRTYDGTRIIFCDTEKSNWTWDPVAGAYYWHRFYAHQPDLNYDNPRVLTEILNIMRFWLGMGVDGMRLDAVPYLIEREGTNNENLPETHAILRRIRAVLDDEFPGRMLLAEANQWPEDAQEYFGRGDECHMAFHFPLMPRMYMAIAQEDRFPITDILRQTPAIPPACQWAIFLRNHDELTLEMVTSRERDYLWKVYAADPMARINLGIRRRLAPLLEGDRRRIELMTSLLLSMPGTPVLYYGDELGMGDNIQLGDRNGVRTPMQWTPDRNGGFSRADPEKLAVPVLMGPLYGYEVINVEAQQRNPHSLLNWTRRLLTCRARTQAFGRGTLSFLYAGNRKILAYLREWEDVTILCVANLSASAQPVELPMPSRAGDVPIEMLAGTAFPAIGELPYLLTLPPYGFYWFELSHVAQPPDWHREKPEQMPELVTLVLRSRTPAALNDTARHLLESEALPAYLARQRWYAGRPHAPLKLEDTVPLTSGCQPREKRTVRHYWALVHQNDTDENRLSVPFSLRWGEEREGVYPMARIRCGSEPGFLVDAFQEPDFLRALVCGLCETPLTDQKQDEGADTGGIRLQYLRVAEDLMPPQPDAAVRWIGGEQSNSSAVVDEQVIVKVLRQNVAGSNAEVEMGRLLSQVGYRNTPALLGALEHRDAAGVTRTVAIMHRYVANEGDAWRWTLEFLHRTLAAAMLAGDDADTFEGNLSGYLAFAQRIGQRLAELHAALAPASGPAEEPAASSPPAATHVATASSQRILEQLKAALRILTYPPIELEAEARDAALFLRKQATSLKHAVRRTCPLEAAAFRLRVHGDFHLGQVLVSQADAYLIDFEGEPLSDSSSRRALSTAYKDLGGMLRSFDYAAALAKREVVVPAPAAELATNPAGPAAPGVQGGSLRDTPPASLDALLERFQTRAGAAFLAGYRQARPDSLALDETHESALLVLAQFEKAAYEVCYEAAHRPDWLPVPVKALARLATTLLAVSPENVEEEA